MDEVKQVIGTINDCPAAPTDQGITPCNACNICGHCKNSCFRFDKHYVCHTLNGANCSCIKQETDDWEYDWEDDLPDTKCNQCGYRVGAHTHEELIECRLILREESIEYNRELKIKLEKQHKKIDKKKEREHKRYYTILSDEKMTKKRLIEILHFQYTHIMMPPYNERIDFSKGSLEFLMEQVKMRGIDLQLIQKNMGAK